MSCPIYYRCIVPGLGDNILNLARLREKREQAIANLSEPLRLKLVAPTGPNPGELRMLTYIPAGLSAGAPLVVVLHGCTQNAAAYDHGAGWSTLAERHGFALLFPEQQRTNNPNLCFNWYQLEDVTRGQGEVESIRQMILQSVRTHSLDARRVFITGLSAGGAMTAAMLATAPELFAGGAIIAGLPYGSANGMMEAFGAMNPGRHLTAAEWGNLVRAASPNRGPWPGVQIWHGTADSTVHPSNAAELTSQWSNVLGLPARPMATAEVDGARHDTWTVSGRIVLENWTIPGLAHGTPIEPDADDSDQAVGVPGPHMLASTVASTWHIARRWGLLTQAARPRTAPVQTAAPLSLNPKAVIERAMKAAGLFPG